MMTEILDDLQEKKNERKTFSYLSFVFAILSVVFLSLIWIIIPKKILASEGLEIPNLGSAVAFATMIACLLGLGFAITSFKKKEPNNFFKWFGLIINLLTVLMFIGSIAFAIFIDNNLG